MSERFTDIIGQDFAKQKLGRMIDSYSEGGWIPPLIFRAPKGHGKTAFAKSFASHIPSSNDPTKGKKWVNINSAALRNVDHFVELWQNYIQGEEVVMMFDEAHEIPKKIEQYMLSLFDLPKCNKNPRNEVTVPSGDGDFSLEADFKRQVFIFATTEYDRMFHALVDRLSKIVLEDYTREQIAQIIKIRLDDMPVEEEALQEVSKYCKDSPRSAIQLADDIRRSMNELTLENWNNLKKDFGIVQFGLERDEIQVLQFVADNSGQNGLQLQTISNYCGMPSPALRKTVEPPLIKNGLITIKSQSRRFITPKGREFINSLN
jgi:Holliday junction resolvasome RuvABC ATP-dependent DNA helicase subunit